MNNISEQVFENVEEDYQGNFDADFIEFKIYELDSLIKNFQELYFCSDLQTESLINVITEKSTKLRKYFQLFLQSYLQQNFSRKNI